MYGDSDKKDAWILVSIVLFFVLAVAASSMMIVANENNRADKAYQSGYEANKLGIRPEANPYIHSERSGSSWFRGWVDSEKAKQ